MPLEVFAGQSITTRMMNDLRMKMVVQTENQEVVNSQDLVPSEIVIPVESGATYWYQAVITYSASDTNVGSPSGGGFRWNWAVPTGTAMPRQTAAYSLLDPSNNNINTGGNVILRSPAASTDMRAQGVGEEVLLSVHEYGTIQVGGQGGDCVLQFAQWDASSVPTILRGILRTRAFYQQVQ